MSVFFIALGAVLVFEGLFYALAPNQAKKMADFVLTCRPEELRTAGAIGLGVGVILLYLFY